MQDKKWWFCDCKVRHTAKQQIRCGNCCCIHDMKTRIVIRVIPRLREEYRRISDQMK